jgi:hypothetical protein
MNEQQLADLFSEQLDQMLSGNEPAIPSEAAGLEELLGLGQQFSQVEFQVSPAKQVAFQSQVAAWFGPGSASAVVISKTSVVVMGIVLAVIAAGTGLLLITLPAVNGFLFDTNNPPEIIEEPASIPDSPQMSNSNSETTETIEPTTVDDTTDAAPNNSQGDIIPAATSSQGDTLPAVSPSQDTPSPKVTFSHKDSLSIPVEDETEPATTTVDGEVVDTTADDGGSSQDSGSDNSGGDPVLGDKDDRGHGNDADGFDEDNPGNSLGIDKLGRGGESSGGSGNGQQSGNDKNDKGNSGNKGGGKGKGK